MSGPRVIAHGATIDPNNVTDKDCADLAACLEREHVKRVIEDVYKMIDASGFRASFKMAFESGIEELEYRLLESWGEDPAVAGWPKSPPAQGHSQP